MGRTQLIHADAITVAGAGRYSQKAIPVDTDILMLGDSADSNETKRAIIRDIINLRAELANVAAIPAEASNGYSFLLTSNALNYMMRNDTAEVLDYFTRLSTATAFGNLTQGELVDNQQCYLDDTNERLKYTSTSGWFEVASLPVQGTETTPTIIYVEADTSQAATLTGLAANTAVIFLGHTTAGDGGGQIMYYKPTGRPATLDGFAIAAGGADDWFESIDKTGAIPCEQFGAFADTGTDQSTALQAWLDAWTTYGFSGIAADGKYRIDSGLTIDANSDGNLNIKALQAVKAARFTALTVSNPSQSLGLRGNIHLAVEKQTEGDGQPYWSSLPYVYAERFHNDDFAGDGKYLDGGSQTVEQRLLAETCIGVLLSDIQDTSVHIEQASDFAIPLKLRSAGTSSTQNCLRNNISCNLLRGKFPVVIETDSTTNQNAAVNANTIRVEDAKVGQQVLDTQPFYPLTFLSVDNDAGRIALGQNRIYLNNQNTVTFVDCEDFREDVTENVSSVLSSASVCTLHIGRHELSSANNREAYRAFRAKPRVGETETLPEHNSHGNHVTIEPTGPGAWSPHDFGNANSSNLRDNTVEIVGKYRVGEPQKTEIDLISSWVSGGTNQLFPRPGSLVFSGASTQLDPGTFIRVDQGGGFQDNVIDYDLGEIQTTDSTNISTIAWQFQEDVTSNRTAKLEVVGSAPARSLYRLYDSSGLVMYHSEANPEDWVTTTAYSQYDAVKNAGNVYRCLIAGTSGGVAPTHTSGTATDNDITWLYVRPTSINPLNDWMTYAADSRKIGRVTGQSGGFDEYIEGGVVSNDDPVRVVTFHPQVKTVWFRMTGNVKFVRIWSDNVIRMVNPSIAYGQDSATTIAANPNRGKFQEGWSGYVSGSAAITATTGGWAVREAWNEVTSYALRDHVSSTPDSWIISTAYSVNDVVINGVNAYRALNAATSGATAPVHVVGDVSDGSVLWRFLSAGTPSNIYETQVAQTGGSAPTHGSGTTNNWKYIATSPVAVFA